MNNTRIVSS